MCSHVLHFGNRLKEELCCIHLYKSSTITTSLQVWVEILVANLATNFQDLVAKVKNLVALASVLGAILHPDFVRAVFSYQEIVSVEADWWGFWKLTSSWSLSLLCSLVLLTKSDRQTIGHKIMVFWWVDCECYVDTVIAFLVERSSKVCGWWTQCYLVSISYLWWITIAVSDISDR